MTPSRIALLDDLDFEWDAQGAAWERHFNDLVHFKEKVGHCHVPLSYARLGLWVKEQRHHFKLMKASRRTRMTPRRSQMLEDIGFCWNTHDASWLARYHDLKLYKKRYGDCNVPEDWPKDPALGVWVKHQRHFFNGYRCDDRITPDRITKLTALGFEWEVPNTDASSCSTSRTEEEGRNNRENEEMYSDSAGCDEKTTKRDSKLGIRQLHDTKEADSGSDSDDHDDKDCDDDVAVDPRLKVIVPTKQEASDRGDVDDDEDDENAERDISDCVSSASSDVISVDCGADEESDDDDEESGDDVEDMGSEDEDGDSDGENDDSGSIDFRSSRK